MIFVLKNLDQISIHNYVLQLIYLYDDSFSSNFKCISKFSHTSLSCFDLQRQWLLQSRVEALFLFTNFGCFSAYITHLPTKCKRSVYGNIRQTLNLSFIIPCWNCTIQLSRISFLSFCSCDYLLLCLITPYISVEILLLFHFQLFISIIYFILY